MLPLWCIKPPKIVLDLVHLKKDINIPAAFHGNTRQVPWLHSCLYRWFTGWKCCGLCYEIAWLSIRIYCWSLAIIKALEQIKDSIGSKYIVFTDSLSCLQALHHMKLEHTQIGKVCLYKFCQKRQQYLWVPSHTGNKGNKKADFAAKSALDLLCTKIGVPYSDFKHLISQYIFSTWQDDWSGAVANKLHSVKPVLGDWQSSYRRCRKDEVVLCRARIGHTHLTHSYILKKDPPPQFTTFWWSAIISHGQGMIYLVDVVWWNHLYSTLN